jgi:hypothetical protein
MVTKVYGILDDLGGRWSECIRGLMNNFTDIELGKIKYPILTMHTKTLEGSSPMHIEDDHVKFFDVLAEFMGTPLIF